MCSLQQLGIVDAVWSDDGDSFMIGCQKLIRQHKVDGKRIADHIRVYDASDIEERLDLDANYSVVRTLVGWGLRFKRSAWMRATDCTTRCET